MAEFKHAPPNAMNVVIHHVKGGISLMSAQIENHFFQQGRLSTSLECRPSLGHGWNPNCTTCCASWPRVFLGSTRTELPSLAPLTAALLDEASITPVPGLGA